MATRKFNIAALNEPIIRPPVPLTADDKAIEEAARSITGERFKKFFLLFDEYEIAKDSAALM
jgi:hypothetical protein